MQMIECALVNPAWGCRHVIRASTEAEALRFAAMHALAHGTEPTEEILARSREHMWDDRASLHGIGAEARDIHRPQRFNTSLPNA
jgi:hypothetical protein